MRPSNAFSIPTCRGSAGVLGSLLLNALNKPLRPKVELRAAPEDAVTGGVIVVSSSTSCGVDSIRMMSELL